MINLGFFLRYFVNRAPGPYVIHGSLGSPEWALKGHFYRFSHFCKAHERDQQTDRQTDRPTDRPRYFVCSSIGRYRCLGFTCISTVLIIFLCTHIAEKSIFPQTFQQLTIYRSAADPGICNGGGGSRISVWWGHMASAVARAYNGGLGSEPPAGSRGRAPGRGFREQSPPEAESIWRLEHLLEAVNCPFPFTFLS